ncbi:MAG: hypothetical protein ABIR70_16250 [Bryobacteraceae bacterium]
MKHVVVLLGALLIAAPAFSQEENLLSFELTEKPAQLLQRLGHPSLIVPGGELESWQYQIGIEDNHEFSHILLFRKATGELLSLTRNWEHERNVDEWFPPAETKVYYYSDATNPAYGVRVRRLSGGRVLMAMGSATPGQLAGQVVLIRETELHTFHPWLKLD